MRTRANKNGGVGMDTLQSAAVSGTSGVSMAPTAQLVDKRKSHKLEMCKQKIELQKEKIDELIKERDYLKEQLASALKKREQDTQAICLPSSSSCDSSEEDSSDTVSASSSTASSSEDKKKKRRKKKGKETKSRKSKKMEPKTRKRVSKPDQAVSRYNCRAVHCCTQQI
ncbi:uncharacterized protein DDB_G0280579-like [Dicentrarchus labrax]|uniref:uncharacterized protein DDB_G0280579-like n=1 Tax=Dicentrarchus labrax TaxID=13489 RepID=UPI0021F667BC|nr:uncharacterized protein DDB_G0280579-like [Dicentrarchus labrax]